MTHGEPWKILLIKIGVLSILFPLHHWVEEKATHYLINHKLIDFSSFSAKKYIDKLVMWIKREQ